MLRDFTETDTPLTDQAFFDPLLFTDPVVAWLRIVERTARNQLAVVRSAIAEGAGSQLFQAADSRLTRFLDAPDGELHRALRRPSWQLTDGAPVRLRLERVIAQLSADVDSALEVQAPLQELQRAVSLLRAQYGASMPHFVEEQLRASSLSAERLGQLRTLSDVKRGERGLSRASAVLGILSDAALAGLGSSVSADAVGREEDVVDAPLTTTEFRALRRTAMLRRSAVLGAQRLTRQSVYDTARGLLHVARACVEPSVDGAGASTARPSSIAPAIVEGAALRAFQIGQQRGTTTVGFWAGVLASAARSLSPDAVGFRWTPPTGALAEAVNAVVADEDPSGPNDGSVIYCVPLGGKYVLLTPRVEAWARVYSASVCTGEAVECVAAPSPGFVEQSDLADTDLNPMFTGLDSRYSRWYHTLRRAQIHVVHSDMGEWYGVIEQSGELGTLSRSPSDAQIPARVQAPFRVLRGCPELPVAEVLDEPALVLEPVGPSEDILGLRTRRATTPFLDHPVCLVRSSIGAAKRGLTAVRHEHALFQVLRQTDTGRRCRAAKPVGAGRIKPGQRIWPCYALPAAVWPPRDGIEREWITGTRDDVLVFLQCVARIVCDVHRVGFSLGAITFAEFAVSVEWDDETGRPIPVPVLVTAPAATPLDERYEIGSDQAVNSDRFPMLGVSVLPPLVSVGARASQASDAMAFNVFALDLLMKDEITVPMAPLWDQLPAAVAAARPPIFGDESFAERLIGGVDTRSGEQMLRSLHVLVASEGGWQPWLSSLG